MTGRRIKAMDYINDLHKLCETLANEIGEANEKIEAAGGKLTAGDVDYVDKLTHALKSVKATIAMMDDEGYSNDGGSYRGYSREGGYSGNRSYRRGSYGRGTSYARRDSMGRYSNDNGMIDELYSLMENAPNESVKRDIQRLIDKM